MEAIYKQLEFFRSVKQQQIDETLSGKFQVIERDVLQDVKRPKNNHLFEYRMDVHFLESNIHGSKQEQLAYFQYDGVIFEHQNLEVDSQHNIRQAFIKGIYNTFEDLKGIDESNYTKKKAELKKAYTEFYKFMKIHLKKSYKIIYEEKLMGVLQPLINLLEINMKLVIYDLKTKQKYKILNAFKYKAFVEKYQIIQFEKNCHKRIDYFRSEVLYEIEIYLQIKPYYFTFSSKPILIKSMKKVVLKLINFIISISSIKQAQTYPFKPKQLLFNFLE